jgi:DsbC/DsbD-like thiol-disulfide interchange protein
VSGFGSSMAQRLVLLTAFVAAWACGGAFASPRHSEARLIADVDSIQPGKGFTLGLLIRLPERWHTYWLNPGDDGMAPSMKWLLPEGFTAGPVQWPVPRRFGTPPLVSFGYEREVLLFREVLAPANLPTNRECTVKVSASWLTCDDICVPQTAALELSLPSRAVPPLPSATWRPVFAIARKALPAVDPAWSFRAVGGRLSVTLCVELPSAVPSRRMAQGLFFPATPELVVYGLQAWTRSKNAYCLNMDRFQPGAPLPDRLQGVLAVPGEGNEIEKAFAVDVPISARR